MQRQKNMVAPKPLFRDRDEEEVRGYRDALKLIHEGAVRMSVSEATLCELHLLARGQVQRKGRRHHRTLPGWARAGALPPGFCGGHAKEGNKDFSNHLNCAHAVSIHEKKQGR